MRRWEWFQELRLPFVIENIGFSHSTCVRLLDLPMFKSLWFKSSFFWHFDSVRASVFCLRARAVFVYSYLGLQSKSCIFREQDWKIKRNPTRGSEEWQEEVAAFPTIGLESTDSEGYTVCSSMTMVHVLTFVNRVGDTEHVSPARPFEYITPYFCLWRSRAGL